MRDCGEPGVNRNGSVPARERNPEFVAFAQSFVRLVKNEVGSVGGEILGSDYMSGHSRMKSDRTM
jgi:hypothetical protein